MNNQDRRREVMLLFEAVSELPVDQRASLLKSSDPEVAREVLQLLSDFDNCSAESGVAQSLRPPERIGRYVVLEPLGRGGMGEVWSARDTELDRPVALKFLRLEAFDGRSSDRLIREAKAVSALNHPNIVTVHEVIESDTGLAIVMELVDGIPLRSLIGAPSPVADVLRIGCQVAEALKAAHAHGIIHRDIKPENIMVRADGYVKLLDFGLARRANSGPVSVPGLAAGTLRYMSPEQARGDTVGSATDIFSLGLVLFELASGRHPFPGDSAYEVAHAILTRDPARSASFQSRLPGPVVSLLDSMLGKDPQKRPTAEQVARVLSPPGHAATPSWRYWTRSLGIAAAALLLVAGAGLGIHRWTGRSQEDISPPRVVPAFAAPGYKNYPSFSPDASQIAFAWNGNGASPGLDIYVKVIGAGDPLRLTTSPQDDFLPAWSPDGRQIVFSRRVKGVDKQAIFLIPALGGPERKVADAGVGVSWSPDGGTLALVRRPKPDGSGGVYLLSLKTGQERDVTHPEPFADGLPVFSPDGKWVAFTRSFAPYSREIFVVSSRGGTARQLTFDKTATNGVAWTADSRDLVISSSRAGGHNSLWRVAVSGGPPKEILAGAHSALFPTISRRGDRVSYTDTWVDLNIYEYEGPGFGPGRMPGVFGQSKILIESSRQDTNPGFSPDGKWISFVSSRGGSLEVWTSDRSGGQLRQVTSFGGPMTGSARWSPDGRSLACRSNVAGSGKIFVVPVEGGAPRQLTFGHSSDDMPAWSSDGAWIYYISELSGDNQIRKLPSAGGAPVQIIRTAAKDVLASPDGKSLFFTKEEPGIWSVPVDGGEEQVVPGLENTGAIESWGVVQQGIYFVSENKEHPVVRFYGFRTRKIAALVTLDRKPYRGQMVLALSPDGRSLLYARRDRDVSDIMVADGFH